MYYTKNRIIFVNERCMSNICTLEVNEYEAELIFAIRNYVKSYPDGYPELLDYAQRLFDDLTYPFKD